MSDVTFRLNVSDAVAAWIRDRWKPKNGITVAKLMDDAIVGGKQFPRAYSTMRGSWKPLSEKHVKWKLSRGYSEEPWIMTGRTLRSLDTPVRTWSAAGGRALNRVVRIVENAAGRVGLEWAIRPPAAGGYFNRNNQVRPWAVPVFGDIRAAGVKAIKDYIATWIGVGR